MRLKIKTGVGQSIVSLDDTVTVQDLFAELGGTPHGVKFGFPPKPLDISNPAMKLVDLGVKNGEILIVAGSVSAAPMEAPVEAPGAAPAPAPVKSGPANIDKDTPYITLSQSRYVILRKIPDDNSCLFNSIAYLVFGPHTVEDPFNAQNLRTVIASTVAANASGMYDKATLDGKTAREYGEWITKPNSWGGAIELQILGEYLGVSILTMDVETENQYWFNEGSPNFIAVLYSGIHYDAITYQAENGEEVSSFVKGSELGELMVSGVCKLTSYLRQQGYFTNTSSFKIKCGVCGAKLSGEKDASKHAKETGHYDFSETG